MSSVEVSSQQAGGNHYAADYKHWDMVLDLAGLDYLRATATKYLSRFRNKGAPALDLQKAATYLVKAAEGMKESRGAVLISFPGTHPAIRRFLSEENLPDACAWSKVMIRAVLSTSQPNALIRLAQDINEHANAPQD